MSAEIADRTIVRWLCLCHFLDIVDKGHSLAVRLRTLHELGNHALHVYKAVLEILLVFRRRRHCHLHICVADVRSAFVALWRWFEVLDFIQYLFSEVVSAKDMAAIAENCNIFFGYLVVEAYLIVTQR